jgi:hypothetical protein
VENDKKCLNNAEEGLKMEEKSRKKTISVFFGTI